MSEVKQGDLKNYNTGDILTPFQKVGQNITRIVIF